MAEDRRRRAKTKTGGQQPSKWVLELAVEPVSPAPAVDSAYGGFRRLSSRAGRAAAARELVEQEVHVWEVAVGETHQQQGIGTLLMARIEAAARDAGAAAVTLTTFSDVAWNGPFYASLGYEVIEPWDYSARLRRILELEVQAGIPADRRCAMRLRL